MKFSITIPTYKSKFLQEAIESVVSQTYEDWELIIVDDCSPEDIEAVAKPYMIDKRVHYYRNEKNCGSVNVVDNWNICLGYATGDYVICIGDDDRLLPCCLEEYKKLIEKYPTLNVYHARTEIIDERGYIKNLQEQRPEWESALSLIWNRWDHRNRQYIGDFCYKREFLQQVGGYYKLPLAWGSDDITAVLAAKEKGIANTQTFCFQYRENSHSITSSTANAKIKIEASMMQNEWYDVLLSEMKEREWKAEDKNYLQTIDTPRKKFYQEAFDKTCVDYIKGNPLRMMWCYRKLKKFNYPKTTFVKWLVKSVFA